MWDDGIPFGLIPETEFPPSLFLVGVRPGNPYALGRRRQGETTDMGILRRFDRHREQRTRRDLPLMVWGVDARGERRLQAETQAEHALNPSLAFTFTSYLSC